MKVFGITGWSGSGKTTLMKALIPNLTARGLRISTIKHAHHRFDVDKPGKDSYEHRAAGATEVMIGSANRWALMHELRDEAEPRLEDLIARMTPVDLLLVEGFKTEAHTKMEVYRAEIGKPMLWQDDPNVVAVASDAPVPGLTLPRLDLSDIQSIGDFIVVQTALARAS